jgi:hypothetical protein
MSSLVTYASPWNNDNDNPNKKRTPTMRKTIKNRPSGPQLGDADEAEYQNGQWGKPTHVIPE